MCFDWLIEFDYQAETSLTTCGVRTSRMQLRCKNFFSYSSCCKSRINVWGTYVQQIERGTDAVCGDRVKFLGTVDVSLTSQTTSTLRLHKDNSNNNNWKICWSSADLLCSRPLSYILHYTAQLLILTLTPICELLSWKLAHRIDFCPLGYV